MKFSLLVGLLVNYALAFTHASTEVPKDCKLNHGYTDHLTKASSASYECTFKLSDLEPNAGLGLNVTAERPVSDHPVLVSVTLQEFGVTWKVPYQPSEVGTGPTNSTALFCVIFLARI